MLKNFARVLVLLKMKKQGLDRYHLSWLTYLELN